jgi:hypothetical protein
VISAARPCTCSAILVAAYNTRLGAVSLFTIVATLGAPLEATAANLAIDTFLPADAESALRLRELTELSKRAAAAPA